MKISGPGIYQCCGSGIRCLFDPGIWDGFGNLFDSGFGIRDGENSDLGWKKSGINIPDPQHCPEPNPGPKYSEIRISLM
jgi:hypothetical protein